MVKGKRQIILMKMELLHKIKLSYPDLVFKKGRKFAFKPPRSIFIGPEEPQDDLLLLHEVGHAILGHSNFTIDVDRLKMESAAWKKARELASDFGVEIDEEMIQNQLDTYRDWLHQKSRCPECGLTRYQTLDRVYHCPMCENSS